MIVSSKDFLSLINEWRIDLRSIEGRLLTKSLLLQFRCFVSELGSDEFTLKWESGDLHVSLGGTTLEYLEPREAPPELKIALESKFVCCLEVRDASLGRLALFEVRED